MSGLSPDQDLTAVQLDVYDRGHGAGLWNPDHGALDVPDGWDLLPSGDHAVTRSVKAAGVFGTVWRPRGRNRPHRRRLGLYAPITTIEAAREHAALAAEQRAKQRVVNSRSRDRAEERYRIELAEAVRTWLDFAPEDAALADEIAAGVAEHAAVVSSGRVGRTRTVPLAERAALAARAYIRHRYTDYEQQLDEIEEELDDSEYRRIKHEAHAAVDAVLDRHRGRGALSDRYKTLGGPIDEDRGHERDRRPLPPPR